jgi:hypothetical protein
MWEDVKEVAIIRNGVVWGKEKLELGEYIPLITEKDISWALWEEWEISK